MVDYPGTLSLRPPPLWGPTEIEEGMKNSAFHFHGVELMVLNICIYAGEGSLSSPY